MDFTYIKKHASIASICQKITAIIFSLLLAKMALSVSMLVIIVFLLSVSEVNSQCPPSSGKTLDVYNNNCIGFYRYLPDA